MPGFDYRTQPDLRPSVTSVACLSSEGRAPFQALDICLALSLCDRWESAALETLGLMSHT